MAKKKTASTKAKKQTTKKSTAKAVKKTTAKKAAPKKSTAKKKTVKKVAKKSAAPKKTVKKAVKKSTAKKTVKKVVKKAASKTTAKKAAPKKATAQKATTKKTVKKAAKEKKPQEAPQNEYIEMAYGMYDGVEICENPKPFPRKSPYSVKDLKAIRNKLEFERNRLREILRGLDLQTLPTSDQNSNVVTPGYSTHLAENATDNIDTETALMLRRDEESALFQVEAALDRLETAIFGVCLACGDKIGMSRLRAVPEAHLCMKCKQIYDKKKPGR